MGRPVRQPGETGQRNLAIMYRQQVWLGGRCSGRGWFASVFTSFVERATEKLADVFVCVECPTNSISKTSLHGWPMKIPQRLQMNVELCVDCEDLDRTKPWVESHQQSIDRNNTRAHPNALRFQFFRLTSSPTTKPRGRKSSRRPAARLTPGWQRSGQEGLLQVGVYGRSGQH